MNISALSATPTIGERIGLRDIRMALRAKTRDDDPFLKLLNTQECGAAYARLALPGDLLEKMLATHLRARTEGFAAQFPRAEYLIICFEGEPVGRLSLTLENGKSGQFLRIVDIAIRDELRGRGIGRDLLCCLIDSALAMGMTRVVLSVFAANEGAIRLYKRIGFRVQGGADDMVNFLMVYPLP